MVSTFSSLFAVSTAEFYIELYSLSGTFRLYDYAQVAVID